LETKWTKCFFSFIRRAK